MTTRTPRSTAWRKLTCCLPNRYRIFSIAHGGTSPRATRSSSMRAKLMLNVGTSGTPRSNIRSIPSSSMRSPCSMLVMPALRAFLMPAVPSACANVPLIPAAFASATMARISSTVNWLASGLSAADSTPPVAMTLIQSAPARIWSRVARRTASTPSAIPGGRSLTSVSRMAPDGVQPSPCPPVWESGVQLT